MSSADPPFKGLFMLILRAAHQELGGRQQDGGRDFCKHALYGLPLGKPPSPPNTACQTGTCSAQTSSPKCYQWEERRWLSAGPTVHNQPFTLANSKHGTSLCGSKSGTAKCKMRFCRNFPPLNIIKKPWMFCHWELPVGKQRGTCIQMVNKIKNRVAGIKLEMNSPFSMRSRKRWSQDNLHLSSFDLLIKKEGQGGFIAEELKQAEFMIDLIIKFCGKKRQ